MLTSYILIYTYYTDCLEDNINSTWDIDNHKDYDCLLEFDVEFKDDTINKVAYIKLEADYIHHMIRDLWDCIISPIL